MFVEIRQRTLALCSVALHIQMNSIPSIRRYNLILQPSAYIVDEQAPIFQVQPTPLHFRCTALQGASDFGQEIDVRFTNTELGIVTTKTFRNNIPIIDPDYDLNNFEKAIAYFVKMLYNIAVSLTIGVSYARKPFETVL